MSPAVFRESVNHGGHEGLTCYLQYISATNLSPLNKRTLWIFLNWDLRLRN